MLSEQAHHRGNETRCLRDGRLKSQQTKGRTNSLHLWALYAKFGGTNSTANEPSIASKEMPSNPEMTASAQLAAGVVSNTTARSVWEVVSKANPHAAHIRNVVELIQELVRPARRSADAFRAILDHRGSWISATASAKIMLKLLSGHFALKSWEAVRHLSAHEFHPFFKFFLDELERDPCPVEMKFYDPTWPRPFLNTMSMRDLENFCDTMNERHDRICRLAKNSDFNEIVRTFNRVPRENRKGLLRFVSEFLCKAPAPCVAKVTTRYRGSEGTYLPSEAYFTPVTHEEITIFRKNWVKSFKKIIPSDMYQGYSILLNHDSESGYYLETFLFLSRTLIDAGSILERLVAHWNGEIAYGRSSSIGFLLNLLTHSEEQATTALLQEVSRTMAPDFYYRVDPPGHERRFWQSRSPVGKLRSRTTAQKRGATSASRPAAASPTDHLATHFAEMDFRAQEEQRLGRQARDWQKWEKKKEKHAVLLSRMRKSAARRAASARSTALQPTASPPPQLHDVDDEGVSNLVPSLSYMSARPNAGTNSPIVNCAHTGSPTSALPSDISAPNQTETQKRPRLPTDVSTATAATPTSNPVDSGLAVDIAPNDGPRIRRRTSEILQLDASGRLRTIQVEVRRKSPRAKSRAAIETAPNNAEVNAPNASGDSGSLSPDAASDSTE